MGTFLLAFFPIFFLLEIEAHARVEIRKPGCYLITAEVIKHENASLNIRLSRRTRGEETAHILLVDVPRFGILKPGFLIQINASTKKAGPLERLHFEAKSKNISFLSSRQLDSRSPVKSLRDEDCL